jgi:hypothetical protein
MNSAPLLREAFELAATGSYRAQDIRNKVNSVGLRTEREPGNRAAVLTDATEPGLHGTHPLGRNKVRGNSEVLVRRTFHHGAGRARRQTGSRATQESE